MPRYDQLFQEIVHTLKEDYAGFVMCQDHHDPRPYVHTIGTAFMQKTLNEDLFFRQVNQYLAETTDRNLRFQRRKIRALIFHLRKFQDNPSIYALSVLRGILSNSRMGRRIPLYYSQRILYAILALCASVLVVKSAEIFQFFYILTC